MKTPKAGTRTRKRRGILCRFGGDTLNRAIKRQEQSLTMTLDGKKEKQSCPNDKRNELCVSMAIKMKDDKSSLQTLV